MQTFFVQEVAYEDDVIRIVLPAEVQGKLQHPIATVEADKQQLRALAHALPSLAETRILSVPLVPETS